MIKYGKFRCLEHLARIREDRSALKFLVDKPKVNRSIGKPSHKWKDLSESLLNKRCQSDELDGHGIEFSGCIRHELLI